MKRRSFLGRLLAGAATAVVAPKLPAAVQELPKPFIPPVVVHHPPTIPWMASGWWGPGEPTPPVCTCKIVEHDLAPAGEPEKVLVRRIRRDSCPFHGAP